MTMGKWEDVSMDFVTKVPIMKGGPDMIWVIMDETIILLLGFERDYMRKFV